MSTAPLPKSAPNWSDWAILWLAVVAVVVSSYLAFHSLSQSKLVGCANASVFSCDAVLGSRWSKVLGIPVAIAGVAVYVATLLLAGLRLLSARARVSKFVKGMLVTAAFAAATSGAWFTLLQFFVVGKLCWYCLTVHSCGVAIASLLGARAWRAMQHVERPSVIGIVGSVDDSIAGSSPFTRFLSPALAGAFATLGLVVFQIFLPTAGHEVSRLEQDALAGVAGFSATNTAVGNETPTDQDAATVPVDDDREVSEVETNGSAEDPDVVTPTEPTRAKSRFENALLIGNREAEHAIVEVLDYTCERCRQMYPTIERVLEKYPEQLAIVVVPVAVDKSCNEYVTHVGHRNEVACKFARLAIAIWQVDRNAFVQFHRWMLEGEKKEISAAWKFAGDLVGTAAILDEINTPSVTERLAVNSRVWNNLEKTLPILIVGGKKIQGTVASEWQLEEMIISYLPFHPH